jgi:hypothetical protein
LRWNIEIIVKSIGRGCGMFITALAALLFAFAAFRSLPLPALLFPLAYPAISSGAFCFFHAG